MSRPSNPDEGYLPQPTEHEEAVWEQTLAQRLPPPEQRSPIEIEVVRDTTGQAGLEHGTLAQHWRALEVWTSNRIYGLNRDLVCIEVFNRPQNTPDPAHPLLGSRLVCGQRQYRSSVHVAFPFPVPGTTAAFVRPTPPTMPRARSIPTSLTSKVERVVLRVLVSSYPLGENAGEEVTSAFLKF